MGSMGDQASEKASTHDTKASFTLAEKPKVRLTLIEKEGRAFLRIEYSDYTPIAQKLLARGFERFYSRHLFGDYEGWAYRYTSNDRIVPDQEVRIKLAEGVALRVKTVDDINLPAVYFTDYDELVVNFGIFRVVPTWNGSAYVVDAPIDAIFIPCFKRFFSAVVKLWKMYLEKFIDVKRVRMNVEFW
ncbi:MAG: hypothetical protein QW794_00295 [Thermosphaera sp.]